MAREWEEHMNAGLKAVDRSIEPSRMTKREALGLLNILTDRVDARREALVEELEAGEEYEEAIEDEDLLEAAETDDDGDGEAPDIDKDFDEPE